MTQAEKQAFEAGRTAVERGLGDKAPCYDPIMQNLMIEPRSKSGRDYVDKILNAWYAGAGRELPAEETYKDSLDDKLGDATERSENTGNVVRDMPALVKE